MQQALMVKAVLPGAALWLISSMTGCTMSQLTSTSIGARALGEPGAFLKASDLESLPSSAVQPAAYQSPENAEGNGKTWTAPRTTSNQPLGSALGSSCTT